MQNKISYTSIHEPFRQEYKKEINKFLSKKFGLSGNFFTKKDISLLINYKTKYKYNPKILKHMKNNHFEQFIKNINTMLNSKKEYISMEQIYDFYILHLKHEP